jgi:hypothetical protein
LEKFKKKTNFPVHQSNTGFIFSTFTLKFVSIFNAFRELFSSYIFFFKLGFKMLMNWDVDVKIGIQNVRWKVLKINYIHFVYRMVHFISISVSQSRMSVQTTRMLVQAECQNHT